MTLQTPSTGEDLWLLGGKGRYELVRGRLVELTPPGGEHGEVATNAVVILKPFVRAHKLGRVVAESGFYVARNPDTVRGPDVAFYSRKRVPDRAPAGYFAVAPDLVVEVVSPNDAAQELEERVRELLAAGVGRVWVLYPRTRSAHVYRADGQVRHLAGDALIEDEELLPGFSCPLSAFFEFDQGEARPSSVAPSSQAPTPLQAPRPLPGAQLGRASIPGVVRAVIPFLSPASEPRPPSGALPPARDVDPHAPLARARRIPAHQSAASPAQGPRPSTHASQPGPAGVTLTGKRTSCSSTRTRTRQGPSRSNGTVARREGRFL
ncbi:MAG: Uma2 family endonuclease [Candidatus Eremiobacterota bacterium]